MGWFVVDLLQPFVHWMKDYGAYVYCPSDLHPYSRARNNCVQTFLRSDYTHLWFIDSDTIPPMHALKFLLHAAVPAVTGVVHSMQKDSDDRIKPCPMVLRRDEDNQYRPVTRGQGVEPIDCAGSACMMLRRDTLEALPFPPYREPAWEEKGGEDFLFCELLRKHDIQLYAHFGVVCKHRKEVYV